MGRVGYIRLRSLVSLFQAKGSSCRVDVGAGVGQTWNCGDL